MPRTQMKKTAACFFLFILSGWSAKAAEIRLKAEAKPAGTVVRLGDVADCNDLSDEQSNWADIALFPAPSAKRPRIVEQSEVRQLLALRGLDMRKVQLAGADAVVIHGLGGKATLVVRTVAHQAPTNTTGKASLPKEHQARQTEAAPRTTAPAADKPELLVHRTDSVAVHSLAAGIRVTTHGKALDEGSKGDAILVQLEDSRERVLGRIIGPQTVLLQSATLPLSNKPAAGAK